MCKTLPVRLIKSFHVTRYTSQGAMFIAVGNVDHDEIVERVNHMFGALSDAPEPRSRPASLDWPVKPVVVEYCDKAQATFQISFRGVTGADPRRHAQTLLASIHGGDYEAAAKATAANGHNKVWECYVAGISPTDIAAKFTAKIEMKDGNPVITWEPNLNTDGTAVRIYKIYGSETLENGGDWQCPTNSLHRFFKVGVEMP